MIDAADSDAVMQGVIDAITCAIPGEAAALGLSDAPGISTGYVLTDPASARTLDEYVEEADGLMYREKRGRKKR